MQLHRGQVPAAAILVADPCEGAVDALDTHGHRNTWAGKKEKAREASGHLKENKIEPRKKCETWGRTGKPAQAES